jgi:hypothetical protein
MSCPRCGQPVSATSNFCTACGYDLRALVIEPAAPLSPPVVLLGECPHCGASNATSRRVCGRCRSALDETVVPTPQERSAPVPVSAPTAGAAEAESPRLLLLVTLIAGFIIFSVLLTLLSARGVGILRTPSKDSSPDGFARLAVTGVTASSTLDATGKVRYGPANLVDGDPSTAWSQGTRAAQGAVGEWVELTLDRQANVARLLVWNGYQRGPRFGESGRVRTLLIDAAGRRFSVDLLDIRGSQSVDLPEPVLTAKIRLTVAAVYEGDHDRDTALSEIDVYGRLVHP